VPRRQRRPHSTLGQHAPGRHAHRQNRRLRVLGEPQFLVRPFKNQLGQRKAQRRIGLGKCLRCHRKSIGKIAAHTHSLRSLPRKKKSDFV
jgi:hypothetical protein